MTAKKRSRSRKKPSRKGPVLLILFVALAAFAFLGIRVFGPETRVAGSGFTSKEATARAFPDAGRPSASDRAGRGQGAGSEDRPVTLPLEDGAAPDRKTEPPASSPRVDTAPAEARPQPALPEPARPRWSAEEMKKEIDRGAEGRKQVSLTFDAGASGEPTPKILDTLKARGLRVTFFLTGKWTEDNPDLVRRMAAEGHEFGNHTYDHKDLTKLSEEEIREEFEKTEKIVRDLTGKSTMPLFRPPYGSRDQRLREIAARAGYRCIYWTLDSWDSLRKDIISQEIASRVRRKISDGSIVLMHCGSEATAQALPGILDELSAQGYRVVSISELTGG
ncbi:MAG: polysaccharide deacetylase family protein [Armatimonadetes bacterium]|nr:polysaccharide deacetylase family protein [Armatimonadota bacterium]